MYTAKTYKKSRRLEFLQRKDHLSQKISNLNDRNNETHLISARFELVAVKKVGLPLRGEQVEQNTILVASIKRLRVGVENVIEQCDKLIETFRLICNKLTLETDATEVEKMIATVQEVSDNRRNLNDVYLSTLHILESNDELIKATLAEKGEKIRQINLDFYRAMEKLSNERIGSEMHQPKNGN